MRRALNVARWWYFGMRGTRADAGYDGRASSQFSRFLSVSDSSSACALQTIHSRRSTGQFSLSLSSSQSRNALQTCPTISPPLDESQRTTPNSRRSEWWGPDTVSTSAGCGWQNASKFVLGGDNLDKDMRFGQGYDDLCLRVFPARASSFDVYVEMSGCQHRFQSKFEGR